MASLAAAPRLATDWVAMSERGGSDPLFWRRYEGAKQSFSQLSRREDVCGVALLDLAWSYSGGYTHLHHDVPLFEVRSPEAIRGVERHANYLVSRNLDAPRLAAYARERCWGRFCLYQRPGGCETAPGYDLNALLAERGE
jgi:hypothetical protein